MAFDNVTFFEVNLPDEIFGAESKEATDEKQAASESQPAETEAAESGGRSKAKLLVVAATLAGVAVGVQKIRSSSDPDEEIEMEYERPGVETEVETEQ